MKNNEKESVELTIEEMELNDRKWNALYQRLWMNTYNEGGLSACEKMLINKREREFMNIYDKEFEIFMENVMKIDKNIFIKTKDKFDEVMKLLFNQLEPSIFSDKEFFDGVINNLLDLTYRLVLNIVKIMPMNQDQQPEKVVEPMMLTVDDYELERALNSVLLIPIVLTEIIKKDKDKVIEILMRETKESVRFDNNTDLNPLKNNKEKMKTQIKNILIKHQGEKITLSMVARELTPPIKRSTLVDRLGKLYSLRFDKNLQTFIDLNTNKPI